MKSNFLPNFRPDLKYAKLRELAKRYHEECEGYDEVVCRGRVKCGAAMPISQRERVLVSKNARQVFRRLASEVPHLDPSELWRSIRSYDFHGEEKQERGII